MNPEKLLLPLALASADVQSSQQIAPEIREVIEMNGARYEAYTQPKNTPEKCDVDLSNFPEVTFKMEKEGPDVVEFEGVSVKDGSPLTYLETLVVAQNGEEVADILDEKEFYGETSRHVEVEWPEGIAKNSRVVFVGVERDLVKDFIAKHPGTKFDRILGNGYKTSDPNVKENLKMADHAEAYLKKIDHALVIFEGENNKDRHIVVASAGVLDENDFEESYYKPVLERAKRLGVKVHFLREKHKKNATSGDLAYIVSETAGTIRSVNRWTERPEHYTSITVMDATPYVAGERVWNIVNGEGQVCVAEVTQEDVEQAMASGRLSDPDLEAYEDEKATVRTLEEQP